MSYEFSPADVVTTRRFQIKRFICRIILITILLFSLQKNLCAWEGEISAGYNRSDGNTETSELSTSLMLNRKREVDEFTVKGNVFYSSSDGKMDAKKWYSMSRYAFGFFGNKLYLFAKMEADHDRFANINYRVMPSGGIGFWISDTEDFKAKVDVGIGLEHTDYRDVTGDTSELTLVPSAFLEKKIFGESKITENVTCYPSLEDSANYRLHSETSFVNPINDKLSLRLSFIEDYDSSPATGTKKNDIRFTSSLVYVF